jgi:hypothetical protein
MRIPYRIDYMITFFCPPETKGICASLANIIHIILRRQSMSNPLNHADIKLAAVCGLFCPSCSAYIGTTEDPERLKVSAARFGLPPEELECLGCRSEKRSFFCRTRCKMAACAADKGIDFCSECDEYPCAELKEFQSLAPHRIELWESLDMVKEKGLIAWYEAMRARYSCLECGTVNSAYDNACRKCGTDPSCSYVQKHKEQIEQNAGKMKR